MNFQKLFSLLLLLSFFLAPAVHADQEIDQEQTHAIAQEIKQLCKTDDTYARWIPRKKDEHDLSKWTDLRLSEKKLSEVYGPHWEGELRPHSLERRLLPLTSEQAPELHRMIHKMCKIFNLMPQYALLAQKGTIAIIPSASSSLFFLIFPYKDLVRMPLKVIESFIAHELIHFIENHAQERLNYESRNNFKKDAGYYDLCRKHEEEADRTALKALRSIEHYAAAIDFFEKEIEWAVSQKNQTIAMVDNHAQWINNYIRPNNPNQADKDIEELQKSLVEYLAAYDNFIKDHASEMDTHPSYKERIAYLKKDRTALEAQIVKVRDETLNDKKVIIDFCDPTLKQITQQLHSLNPDTAKRLFDELTTQRADYLALCERILKDVPASLDDYPLYKANIEELKMTIYRMVLTVNAKIQQAQEADDSLMSKLNGFLSRATGGVV